MTNIPTLKHCSLKFTDTKLPVCLLFTGSPSSDFFTGFFYSVPQNVGVPWDWCWVNPLLSSVICPHPHYFIQSHCFKCHLKQWLSNLHLWFLFPWVSDLCIQLPTWYLHQDFSSILPSSFLHCLRSLLCLRCPSSSPSNHWHPTVLKIVTQVSLPLKLPWPPNLKKSPALNHFISFIELV